MIKIFQTYHKLFFLCYTNIGDIMQYVNGKILQKKIFDETKKTVALLEIRPVLAVISIGCDPTNDFFYKQIKKMCEYVGYQMEYYHYFDISEVTLLNLIYKLNQDEKITSILLELPILQHLSFPKIRNAILPEKDIEGITDINRLKYQNGEGGFCSNTVLGILMLLENYSIDVRQKDVVIINRNEAIGYLLLRFFLAQDCTVTMCHSQTKNLDNYLKQADIVVTAIGEANFFSCDQFKENSIIIEIGIDDVDGNFYGDVDLSKANESKVKYMVKSIGGVGPMTIAAISKSILKSYYLTQKDKENDKSLFLFRELF